MADREQLADDIAFREGCIEACEAILHSDLWPSSAYLTEKHIRERLIEYRASLAELREIECLAAGPVEERKN